MDSLHMKITLLAAALLALAGCRDDYPSDSPVVAQLRAPNGVARVDVYVVAVGGSEYVVVASSDGVAICPKTK